MAKKKKTESDALNRLLKELSQEDVDLDFMEETPKKEINVKVLKNIIEQYLSPFVIIGYDIKGNCVNMGNVQTQKDFDAISLAISRFKINNGIDNDDDDISGFEDLLL